MAAPTVTSISPPTGDTVGGTVALIKGTSLHTTTGVTIGGTTVATFENVASAAGTSLYVIVPAHSAGLVDVVVTNPDGSGTGSNAFTYTVPGSTVYKLHLFDDCCHIWISQDTGNTFEKGCTPGNASTPAPNDPGLDPHGIGTIIDQWIDCCMAINDEDYETVAAIDANYNVNGSPNYGIIGVSADNGRNQTWALIDPEVNAPAFVGGASSQVFARGAISADAETILLATRTSTPTPIYPRISRDSGATWANVTGVTSGLLWSLACFGSEASQVMYLKESAANGAAARIWKSTDWGVNWSKLAGGPVFATGAVGEDDGIRQRMRCSADGQTVIASYADGNFWISTDAGANWTNTDFSPQFIGTAKTGTTGASDCGITPDGQTIIVSFEQTINSGSWPAVFVSTDGGANFTDVTLNLKYQASVGGTPSSPSLGNQTGCNGCNVAPDGLGMVVTSATPSASDFGIIEPNGLEGKVLFANVSVDAGATWRLVAMDADPYESGSALGVFTGIYITPSSETPPVVVTPSVTGGKHGGPFPSAMFMPPLGRWAQYAVIVHLDGAEVRPSKAFPKLGIAQAYVETILEEGITFREEFYSPSDILHIWLADEDGNMNQVHP